MVFSVPTWRFTSAFLKPQLAISGAIALSIGLGGCSLLLNFDDPLEAAIDGGSTIDAASGADASSAPDAAPTEVCNASDRELETGKNNNNDTRGDATPLNGGAMETISSILCTETGATPDIDFFRLLVGAGITEDITITLSPTTGQDLSLRLFDSPDGTHIQEAPGALMNTISRSIQNKSQLAPGTYYLEVYSISSSSAKNEYTLEVVRVPNPALM